MDTPVYFSRADEDVADHLGRITAEQLDALPYGAIQLDYHGYVIAYNATEERLSGFSRRAVSGRHFFTEVAPCTQVREFLVPFREAALQHRLSARFDFRFVLPLGARDVRIHMICTPDSGGVWILVREE